MALFLGIMTYYSFKIGSRACYLLQEMFDHFQGGYERDLYLFKFREVIRMPVQRGHSDASSKRSSRCLLKDVNRSGETVSM